MVMVPKRFIQLCAENTAEVVCGESPDPSITSASVGESEAADSWNFLAT